MKKLILILLTVITYSVNSQNTFYFFESTVVPEVDNKSNVNNTFLFNNNSSLVNANTFTDNTPILFMPLMNNENISQDLLEFDVIRNSFGHDEFNKSMNYNLSEIKPNINYFKNNKK
ncbi:MAG: hypothetical protein ACJAVA_000218 [Flavobacteriaceae bacterium]|jgi:hypothetical protein